VIIRNLTKQECQWLIDLTNRAKEAAAHANVETPHSLFELRRDNMEVLGSKLNTALRKQIQKERGGAR